MKNGRAVKAVPSMLVSSRMSLHKTKLCERRLIKSVCLSKCDCLRPLTLLTCLPNCMQRTCVSPSRCVCACMCTNVQGGAYSACENAHLPSLKYVATHSRLYSACICIFRQSRELNGRPHPASRNEHKSRRRRSRSTGPRMHCCNIVDSHDHSRHLPV